jgi:tRNA (cmo5U34)-methyltransferase
LAFGVQGDPVVSVREAFDKGAKDYDSARKQLIPCFNEFYGTALDLISALKTDDIKVLDLGAGTVNRPGNFGGRLV